MGNSFWKRPEYCEIKGKQNHRFEVSFALVFLPPTLNNFARGFSFFPTLSPPLPLRLPTSGVVTLNESAAHKFPLKVKENISILFSSSLNTN